MTKKYTMSNGADFYAQNGSTEFKVISSTGDVISGRVMYGNSSDNEAIDSSGNIYVNSNIFTGSSDASIVDSSGNFVLGSSGQYFAGTTSINVIDSTGNIYVNGVIYNGSSDAIIVDSSGNLQINKALYGASTVGHVICDSSGNLSLGSSGKLFADTTGSTSLIADSSGQLYHRGYSLESFQTISSGAPASNINGYDGVTIIQGDTGGSYYINAPAYAGVKKKLVFSKGSTSAYLIKSSNSSGTGWNLSFNGTTEPNSSQLTVNTSSLGGSSDTAKPFSLELFGVSTNVWLVSVPLSYASSNGSTSILTLAST